MISSATYDKLYEIAESQAGYFASRQAIDAGVDRSILSRQVGAGRLRRVRHGIYRLVHFPSTPDEDLVVAWLETGPGSVISHDSALALHNLSDPLPSEIHVTVSRTASRRRPGIRLHTNHLSPQEITQRSGVAVTTVPRTIADVAARGLSEEFVIQAVREAVLNGLATPDELLSAARSERVRRLIRRSLEKLLKACIVKQTGDLAPRSHNVVRLAEIARLSLSETVTDLLADMNIFNKIKHSRDKACVERISVSRRPPTGSHLIYRPGNSLQC